MMMSGMAGGAAGSRWWQAAGRNREGLATMMDKQKIEIRYMPVVPGGAARQVRWVVVWVAATVGR